MLSKTNSVDSILHDPRTGEYELVLGIEAGEWSPQDVALEHLKDKIDGYAHFALDGEMHDRYPESKGKPVVVTVVSVDPVPSFFEKWIKAFAGLVTGEGLTINITRAPLHG